MNKIKWNTPGLKFTLVQWTKAPLVWELKTAKGTLTGEEVEVELPFTSVPQGPGFRQFITTYGKRDGVHTYKSRFFDSLSFLQ